MSLKQIITICGCAILIELFLGTSTLHAQNDESSLMRVCEAQISAKFRQWRVAPVTPEVEQFTKSRNESPTRVSGDFDGDGRRDLAILFLDGPDPNPELPGRLNLLHIAVCLNSALGVKLFLIDKPYCGDGIALSARGRRYYDFEKQVEGVYKLDGVHAYCFEKAGATYQFENGSFRRIVDSD